MNSTEKSNHVPVDAAKPYLLVIHGANLNLLGDRPAEHYGVVCLEDLESMITVEAGRYGWDCVCRQTNHEGEFIELVHQHRKTAVAIIVNPGAWTHYSYAIRDALELADGPVAEVHLSDINSREDWRQVSVIRDVVACCRSGMGPDGYLSALRELVGLVEQGTEGNQRE